MAFPTITQIVHGGWTSNQTSGTVAWPTTASGDLIIGIGQCDGGAGDHVVFPGDWDTLVQNNQGQHGRTFAYIVADGTESGTFTCTIASTEVADIFVLRIVAAEWHGTTPPEFLLGDQVTSDAPDVGELTASWGSDDNLWICATLLDNGSGSISTYPLPDNNTTHSGLANAAICSDELAQAALNPDAWLWSQSDQCSAGVIVVRPAAAGGPASGPNTLTLLGVG